MRGIPFVGGLALLALGLLGPAALAGEEPGLQEEVAKLRQEVKTLKSSMLENEIDTYLEDQSAWTGAQGGGMQGVTIHARFTAVSQNTIGMDVSGPADVSADHSLVNGNVDIDFDFQVTDNLTLFVYLTASENADSHVVGTNLPVPSGGSLPLGFSIHRTALAGSFASTLAGADDGIGVNGTTPTDPGSITVYEAGIQHSFNVGDNKLHWELGSLDPRNRFLQSSISDNADTNFIHNAFDDPSSVPWRTGAIAGAFNSGNPNGNAPRIQGITTIVGWHFWMSFGDNKQYTINWGWFNGAGQFWDRGTFMIQFHWKGEVSGREMNVRLMGFLDESLRDGPPPLGSNDGSAGGGAVWDWMVTDDIGVFFKIATNGGDTQVVELDASLGVVFYGLIGSRPDDKLGIGVSFASANDGVLNGGTWQEDTEFTLEIYYTYMMEDGKLQITPHLIFVSDPGGGDGTGVGTTSLFTDDQLFILGVRIHVPF